MEAKADYLFELSWEVCNKVGGIYTVVSSKVLPMKRFYKNYYTIGPYFPGSIKEDNFKESLAPDFLKKIFENMQSMGIKCHYGKWIIEGEPDTILIDYGGFKHKINDFKAEFWEKFQIDSLNSAYHDYDEPMLWSICAGILLEQIKNELNNKSMVVQCHEWLSGGALLYLKARNVKIGSVFTTHATMLGRTLASNHVDLYGELQNINPEEQAYKFGIPSKYTTEKACAHNADVFTTVSEITGLEATHFLKKKPDILLPNGLDIESFPTFDDASVKHKLLKGKVKNFLMYYFFPYYLFNLDDTLIFFIAGRYEFQNKGIDMYIKALGKLNEQLKNNGSTKTIIAFVWVPTGVKEIKPEILENKTFFEDIDDSLHDMIEELNHRILYGLLARKELDREFLLGKTVITQIQKKLARFSREGNPPVCTHNLQNEEQDKIINNLKINNLNNKEEDKIKVIFYPIYLTGADQLLDLNYYESIMASHLGVFPSYYEPWGYTPMETGALGIASVTTDLAGFGRYVQKMPPHNKNPGIYVLDRLEKSEEEIVNQLLKIFNEFVKSSKQDRIENKLRAKRIADTASWNLLIENYLKAHNMAVKRINKS